MCLLEAVRVNRNQVGYPSPRTWLPAAERPLPAAAVTQKRHPLQLAAGSPANQPFRLQGNQEKQ